MAFFDFKSIFRKLIKPYLGVIQNDINYANNTVESNVRNISGSLMPKGSIVYVNGAIGNKPTITLADYSTEETSSKTYGIVKSDIADNSNGVVLIIGTLTNVNTSQWTPGQSLWLSNSADGQWNNISSIKPSAPKHAVFVGSVIESHGNQGSLQIRIQNGYELGELHDVDTSGAAEGQTIVKEGEVFKAKTLDYSYIGNRPDLTSFATKTYADNAVQTLDTALKTIAKSGNYNDLLNKPDLAQYVLSSALSLVATSGKYTDLSDLPNLLQFAKDVDLATIAKSGKFTDLTDVPLFALDADLDSLAQLLQDLDNALAVVAKSGNYNDLLNKPNLTQYATKISLSALAYSGDWADMINKPNMANYVLASVLSAVAGTGSYLDLINRPDLGIYALDADISDVGKSNDYNDLDNLPSLAIYAIAAQLATVATTGNFNDLINKPNMANYVLASALSSVATSGNYNDLTNKPNLSQYAIASTLATVASTGSYNDLLNRPDFTPYALLANLSAIATSGQYNDLINKPNLGLYALIADLANVAFSGQYADLSGKPDLSQWVMDGDLAQVAITNDYLDLDNKPDLSIFIPLSQKGALNGVAPLDNSGKIPGSYLNLSALTPKGSWDASTNIPALADGTGTNGDFYLVKVAGTIDLGSGNVTYSEGDALVFFTSSNTWERVGRPDSVLSVNGSQGAVVLNTDDISEGTANKYYTVSRVQADQLNADWNATTGKARILNKPNLSTVATTGAYADLLSKPDLSIYVLASTLATIATSGNYNDLNNKPDLSVYAVLANLSTVATSGSWADIINKPNMADYVLNSVLKVVATSGDYNDLSNRPNLNLKADKATTLNGYGITDAVSIDDIVITPAGSKILRLDANGELPTNSSSASKLKTARKIQISGDVSGEANFDGSSNINIQVNNSDLIKKNSSGGYPALDGSQITGIIAQINEVTTDPLGVGNGGMWLLRTDYQEGEFMGALGMTPIIQEDRVDFELKIKTSKGIRTIATFNN